MSLSIRRAMSAGCSPIVLVAAAGLPETALGMTEISATRGPAHSEFVVVWQPQFASR